jgi:hypothetical protein
MSVSAKSKSKTYFYDFGPWPKNGGPPEYRSRNLSGWFKPLYPSKGNGSFDWVTCYRYANRDPGSWLGYFAVPVADLYAAAE